MDLKEFGQRLKNCRRKNTKMTQGEFADKLNKHDKTIKNWEQGLHLPELKDLADICKLLNCNADYLLGNIDESTHDLHFIAQETGLTEQSIKKIQNMWLRYRTDEEVWRFDNPQYDYDNALTSIDAFKSFWNEYGIYSPKYQENSEHCINEIIKEKQKKSRALSALNDLLSSSIGETILENIYAYLNIEYVPTEEELKKTKEFNTRYGKKYKAVIKAKNGFIDAAYLNTSFLIILQHNLQDLKKELYDTTDCN